MNLEEIVLRVLASFVLGGIIGAERQWRQRLAGLRTNTLVSIGATMFVLVAVETVDEVSPTRIAAQVVSGIGFLGAGVIFKEGLNVRGLNTAATLWCSAAVGTLVGAGFLTIAVAGAMAVLLANMMLRPLSRIINKQPQEDVENEIRYCFRVGCREHDKTHMRKLILQTVSEQETLTLCGIFSEDREQEGRVEVLAELFSIGRRDVLMENIMSRIGLEDGVHSVSWQVIAN